MRSTEAVVPAKDKTPNDGDSSDVDAYRWLEDVEGKASIEWVQARNDETASALVGTPLYKDLYAQALETLNTKGRIPQVKQRGAWLYDFWQDKQHPRGIYRRTTLTELRKEQPEWETLIDIDAMSEDGTHWVFKGVRCLSPEYRRCLVFLSKGGGDATLIKEYDHEAKSFVPDGFELPEAKSRVAWLDHNTLIVGTNYGPGSMTSSGYPRILKAWKRGTPLSQAQTIIEAKPSSMSVYGARFHDASSHIDIVSERVSFWKGSYFQWENGKLLPLSIPEDASITGYYRGGFLLSLKSDWERGGRRFVEGSVVFAPVTSLRGEDTKYELVVEPTATAYVQSVHVVSRGVLVTMLDNVRSKAYMYERAESGWEPRLIDLPDMGTVSVVHADQDSSGVFIKYEGFLTPPGLYYLDVLDPKPELIVQQPATFDSTPFAVKQYIAVSRDGTKVPYFLVAKRDMPLDGTNPTHIFSYGGFRLSLTPGYSGSYTDTSGAYGKMWLERGGVFVLANIRGGGEFGPAWHQAALKEHRTRAFEDFEAVAQDLVARKVTAPKHIGIEGRSNGGLLVGATMLRRPELYGAVICGVPLLDMKRYHLLFAGASWMGEYGDPDKPEEWAYISQYSPYQRVAPGKQLPPIFLYTSTQDDRVHPSHARKMAARLLSYGYTAFYYENLEGGHGGSSTHEQLAYRLALAYTFLWRQLGSASVEGEPEYSSNHSN